MTLFSWEVSSRNHRFWGPWARQSILWFSHTIWQNYWSFEILLPQFDANSAQLAGIFTAIGKCWHFLLQPTIPEKCLCTPLDARPPTESSTAAGCMRSWSAQIGTDSFLITDAMSLARRIRFVGPLAIFPRSDLLSVTKTWLSKSSPVHHPSVVGYKNFPKLLLEISWRIPHVHRTTNFISQTIIPSVQRLWIFGHRLYWNFRKFLLLAFTGP